MAWELEKHPFLLIAIPTRGIVSTRFCASLIRLDVPDNTIWTFIENYPIDIARNLAVSQALAYKCQYLFFIDDDIVLKEDTLMRLLDLKLPIVSGLYYNKTRYEPVARINNESISVEKNALIQVEEIGLGICLIECRLFERLALLENMIFRCINIHDEPNIELRYGKRVGEFTLEYNYKQAKELSYRCERCKNWLLGEFFQYNTAKVTDGRSEDFHFCQLLKKHQIPVFVDTSIVGKHIATAYIDDKGIRSIFGGDIE